MSTPKADKPGLKLIFSWPSEMMPMCNDRKGGGGNVGRGAYLNWSSHNSTSVAGGLKKGERGMLFITFA
jgi:hypothetical protein